MEVAELQRSDKEGMLDMRAVVVELPFLEAIGKPCRVVLVERKVRAQVVGLGVDC